MNREKKEYLARAFGCGIHEGDTVRLLRAWTEEEGGHAGCRWEEGLARFIGVKGRVKEVCLDGDFRVTFSNNDGGCWFFPYFVLEKVEDR